MAHAFSFTLYSCDCEIKSKTKIYTTCMLVFTLKTHTLVAFKIARLLTSIHRFMQPDTEEVCSYIHPPRPNYRPVAVRLCINFFMFLEPVYSLLQHDNLMCRTHNQVKPFEALTERMMNKQTGVEF